MLVLDLASVGWEQALFLAKKHFLGSEGQENGESEEGRKRRKKGRKR